MLATTAAVGYSTSAWAQTAASDAAPQSDNGAANRSISDESVNEIVVTAQKRAQRLLDTPLAVSAVGAEDLTKQNLSTLKDFYNRVPGLQYSSRRVSGLSLRGVTTGGNTNPTVAILVDDIPFGSSTNNSQPPIPDFDPATLERIEILRGPQGTLYGASSLGGLIKYVTRDPNTEEYSGRLESGIDAIDGGDFGFSARGSANIPISRGRLALRVSGFYRDDASYIDNILPGAVDDDVNHRQVYGGRASLLFQATDNLSIKLSALRQELSTTNSELSATYAIPVCAACRTPEGSDEIDFTPVYGDLKTSILPSTGDASYQLYSGHINLDLGWADLVSISAWSRADNVLQNDVTPVFGGFLLPAYGAADGSTVAISNGSHTKKFSQELRLESVGSTMDWVVGLFYTKEDSSLDQTLFALNPDGSQIAVPYIGTGPGDYEEYAAFGAITYHATSKFDIQIGGRYARNEQSSSQVLIIDTPAEPFFGPSSTISAPSEEGAFTWLISPSYHFTPDLMGYARVATGYRPGGPNVGVPNVDPTFDSDSVTNYEVGLKGYVIPDVLSLDLALFQIDWSDIQLQNTEAVSQLTFLSNGSEARSRGVELAGQWRPWSGFSVDGNVAYTDAELTKDLPEVVGNTGLMGSKGDRLPFSAKFAASVSAQQEFALSATVTGVFGATYSYVGDRRSTFRTNAPEVTRPRYDVPSYSVVDLRAGFDFGENWQLNATIRNVFDERGIVRVVDRNGTNVPTAVFIQPRTFGLKFVRNF